MTQGRSKTSLPNALPWHLEHLVIEPRAALWASLVPVRESANVLAARIAAITAITNRIHVRRHIDLGHQSAPRDLRYS